jgi:hypothetical protein
MILFKLMVFSFQDIERSGAMNQSAQYSLEVAELLSTGRFVWFNNLINVVINVLVLTTRTTIVGMWYIVWCWPLCFQRALKLGARALTIIVVVLVGWLWIVVVIIVWTVGRILRRALLLQIVWLKGVNWSHKQARRAVIWLTQVLGELAFRSVWVYLVVAWRVRGVLRRIVVWTIREFGEPAVCAVCVYLGVLSTSTLPLVLFAPVELATITTVTLSPLAAFAVAARVFDSRAYRRWQQGHRSRLGARLLRSFSDGVTWVLWLRPPVGLTI